MKFEDVVAQGHVTKTLENAITGDRLASAYLFSGPRGVGKTTSARIFAKAINCDKGPSPIPCNQCETCNEITTGRSLSVFEIDGASNRGIDEVRNLRENLKYAATPGKYKIYIIDEVHMLTTEAFNALLKTLEEPPPRVLFIFATTEPHKVPATILSRCQRYNFRRIPLADMVAKLRSICNEEKIEIDDESLYLIARKSEGALRDSQSLLDQVVSFCGQKITVSDLTELLGIIDQDFYFECSDCIANKATKTGLDFVERLFSQGFDMSEFLSGLAEHFRNMIVVKTTESMELLEGLDSYAERYKQSAGAFSETDLLRLIQLAADTANQIKRSSNPKLILEITILKMIKMEKSIELGTLLTNLNNLKSAAPATQSGQVSPGSQASAPAGPAVESRMTTVKQINHIIKTKLNTRVLPECGEGVSERGASPLEGPRQAVSLEKIKSEWEAIVDEVKEQRIHLGSFLNEGFPTALKSGVLEISFSPENGFHVNTINQNKSTIERIILSRTGFRIKLRCKKNAAVEASGQGQVEEETQPFVEAEPPALPMYPAPSAPSTAPVEASRPRVDDPAITEEDFMQIPIVKRVLEVFDGEIVR
jgi:DNA polymerase-3 subunit gamma/tau